MSYFDKNFSFPSSHTAITPSDSVPLPQEMLIYANTSGTVRVSDDNGIILTYNVTQGQTLPVVVTQVFFTGTTATVYGLN